MDDDGGEYDGMGWNKDFGNKSAWGCWAAMIMV